MMLGTANAKITLDVGDLLSNADQAQSRLEQLDRAFDDSGRGGIADRLDAIGTSLDNTGRRAQQAGRTITTTFSAPFIAAGASMIKTSMDFETAMNRVKALTGDTGDGFEMLREQAIELSRTTRYTAGEAADAMGFLAMAGNDVNDIYAMMPDVLNLAAAGAIDLGRAADLMTNIMQSFGMEADQAARAADVLTAAFTGSNTSMEQLADAMKFVAPVARSVGWDIEQTAAAIGLLGNAGIQGSMAGTALRNVIVRLANPTGKAADRIEELGVSLVDLDGNLKSPVELVREFEMAAERMGVNLNEIDIDALSTQFEGLDEAILSTGMSLEEFEALDPQAQFDALAAAGYDMNEMLGAAGGNMEFLAAIMDIMGVRGGPQFLALLAQGSDSLETFTDQLYNAAGRAAEVAQTMMQGLGGALNILKATWQAWMITLGDAGALDFATNAVNRLTDGITWLNNLSPEAQRRMLLLGGAAAALGPGVYAAGTALRVMGGAVKALGLSFAWMTGPFLPLILAAGVGFALWQTNAFGARDAMQRLATVGRTFTRHWRGAFNAFRESGRGSFVSGLKATEVALRQVSRIAGPFGGTLRDLGNRFGQAANLVEDLTYNFTRFRGAGVDPVTSALMTLGAVFPGVESVARPLVGVVSSLNDAFGHAGDAIRAFFAGNWTEGFAELGLAAEDAWDAITQAFDLGIDLITSAFEAIDWASLWDGLTSAASDIVGRLGDVAGALWGWFTGMVSSIDWGGALSAAWDVLSGAGSWIVDKLGSAASALWTWITDQVSGVNWQGAFETAWNVLSSAGIWLAGKLGSAVANIGTWIVEQVQGVDWQGAFTSAWSVLSSIGSWLVDTFGSAIDNIGIWIVEQVQGVDWQGAFTSGMAVLSSIGSWIVETFTEISHLVGAWFYDQVSSVPWQSLFDLAVNALAEAGTWIVEKFTDISHLIGTWFYDQMASVPWQPLFDLAINTLSEAGTWIVTKLGEITEALSTWFSSQFEGVDWAGIATTVGTNLRSAVTTGVQNMADIFAIVLSWVSDQIRGVDWNAVGSTFADLLVAGIKGVVLLVGFAAYLLGQLLLALADVNWSAVATTLRDFFKAAVLAIADFLTGFGEKLYTELSDAIAGVDWGALGGQIKDLLVGAVTGVGQAMWDKIWSEFDGGGDIDHNPDFEGGGRGFGSSGGFRGAGGGMAGANLDFGRDLGGGGMFAGLIAEIDTLIAKLNEVPPAFTTAQTAVTTFVASTIGVMGGWTTGIGVMLTTVSTSLTTQTATAATTAQASFITFVATTIGVMGGWTVGIQAQVNSAMDTLRTRASGGTAGALASFVSFVSQTIGVMGEWASGIATMVNTTMTTLQSRTQSGTRSAQSAFQSFTSSTRSQMSSWGSQISSIVTSTMSQMVSRAQSGGQQLAAALRSGAQQGVSAVQSAMSQIPGIISSVGGSAAAAARSVGANIGNSLAAGIRSAHGAVAAAANALVAEADRAVRARAQISSPSKLFADLGEYLGEGFELGIRSMIPDVARATAALVHVPDIPTYAYGRTPVPASVYAAHGGGTVQHHYHDNRTYLALKSEEWQHYAEQAERGGDFARQRSRPEAMTQYLGGR